MGRNPYKRKGDSLHVPLPESIGHGKRVSFPPTITVEAREYPVFCFRYLHKEYGINSCTQQQKAALLEKIDKWRNMTWDEIRLAPRHGLGYEKIARSSIKPPMPAFVTNEVDHLLALRFDGMAPILVQRRNFVMHLIFIDPKMECYKH